MTGTSLSNRSRSLFAPLQAVGCYFSFFLLENVKRVQEHIDMHTGPHVLIIQLHQFQELGIYGHVVSFLALLFSFSLILKTILAIILFHLYSNMSL